MALNWKVAAAGGAVLGLGIGGFTIAGADGDDTQPVRDVDLQSARDSIASLSSPIRVPSTSTTVAAASAQSANSPVAPPATAGTASVSAQSVDSPAPAPAPAPAPPAPVYDDSASPVQPSGGGESVSAQTAASADDSGFSS